MKHNRDDIATIWDFLFPEPLDADEYVEIEYGYPRPTMAQHVQTLDEALAFLGSRPDEPCNYSVHWCTKRPKKLHHRTGKADIYRAWAFIADIEDRINHEHLPEAQMLRDVWEQAQPDLPEFVHDGAEMMAYTGGGLHTYIRLSEPVSGDDLTNMFWNSQDHPGAIGNTYDPKNNRWVDPGSLQSWHGGRLIGTEHPKHGILTRVIKTDMGGTPLDVRRLLADYAPKLEWLKRRRLEQQAKTQVRRSAQVAGDPFEDVKRDLRMIPFFGIKTRQGGDTTYTPVHCPLCDKEDNGNASVNHHDSGDKLYCFASDDHRGDVFDLLQLQTGCTRHEALITLAEAAGIDLDAYKTNAPKKTAKPREEIIDVGSWLGSNGADLSNVTVYKRDGVLGMDIPFNIRGRIVRLSADWDVWQTPKVFKKHAAGQLGIVFRQYPTKPWPLQRFMERCIDNAGPEGIENRDIDGEIELSMRDQFLSMFRSCTPLTPENVAEYTRRNGIPTEPKPDWWEDAEDMIGPGAAATVYATADGYFIRRNGFHKRLRSEYGGEWCSQKFVKIAKEFGFSGKKMRVGETRRNGWIISADRMERNK